MNATDKGVLAMGAATAYCVKEAVKGWWDDIMNTEKEFSVADNNFSYKDLIGKIENHGSYFGQAANEYFYIYRISSKLKRFNVTKNYFSNNRFFVYQLSDYSLSEFINEFWKFDKSDGYHNSSNHFSRSSSSFGEFYHAGSGATGVTSSFVSYIPYVLDGVSYEW